MIATYRKNDKRINEIVSKVLASIQEEVFTELNDAVCGECGSIGNFISYCKYRRRITFIEDGKPKNEELELKRYRCTTCDRTHVVAPGTQIIPYCWYTLGFVLYVLCEYIMRNLTIRQISEEYQISISILYIWKVKFREFYKLLVGELEASERSYKEAVIEFFDDNRISERLCYFVNHHRFGFLQNTKRRKMPYLFVLTGIIKTISDSSP